MKRFIWAVLSFLQDQREMFCIFCIINPNHILTYTTHVEEGVGIITKCRICGHYRHLPCIASATIWNKKELPEL